MRPPRRILSLAGIPPAPEVDPRVEAPLPVVPLLEDSDEALGEPVDLLTPAPEGTEDVHAGWVELVERIRSEKTVIIKLTKH
jgi:hypothetical protein